MNKFGQFIRHVKTLCLIGSIVTLGGCDAALDCIDNDGPEFSTTTIMPAALNQVYRADIEVSIRNEPLDDRFDYRFRVTGNLPPGISSRSSGRTLELSGTATELGSYLFEVTVEVDDGLSAAESGLCFRVRDRDFTLLVEQDNS